MISSAIQQVDLSNKPRNRLLDVSSKVRGGAMGARVTAFEIISVNDDDLTCERVAEIDEDGWPVAVEDVDETTVMKPWLLRRLPFDGETIDGIEYTYTSATEREAESEEGTEEQIITPVYLERTGERSGELIYAVQSIEGYVDINHAGRCWAAVEEDETEDIPAEDLEPQNIMTIKTEEE